MIDAESALAPFLDRPGKAAILIDFDGTLAPIVDDPQAARPLDGAADLLAELARTYGVVGVLSGRPVSFLAPFMPPGVVLSGLYGLEVVQGDGTRSDHPHSGAWREVVADVVRCSADRGPAGMGVETKGLSLTLHYRTRPDLARDVDVWARQQAARSGLVTRPARMSVELHPPIDTDKGSATEQLAERAEAEAVCFVGDDRGDLPAYDALDRLAARGVHTLRVAVGSDESPDELVRRADLVLDGPTAVLHFLRRLAGAAADGAGAEAAGV
ncbi:MAG TPA: trehalose-phosphatase [Acidimicrobiales bacterium]